MIPKQGCILCQRIQYVVCTEYIVVLFVVVCRNLITYLLTVPNVSRQRLCRSVNSLPSFV